MYNHRRANLEIMDEIEDPYIKEKALKKCMDLWRTPRNNIVTTKRALWLQDYHI